jgi:hypothetical protein
MTEIFGFMTDRYGEFVRYNPPLEAKTWLIWGAPFVLLLLGGIIVYRIVRARSRMPLDDEPAAGRLESMNFHRHRGRDGAIAAGGRRLAAAARPRQPPRGRDSRRSDRIAAPRLCTPCGRTGTGTPAAARRRCRRREPRSRRDGRQAGKAPARSARTICRAG